MTVSSVSDLSLENWLDEQERPQGDKSRCVAQGSYTCHLSLVSYSLSVGSRAGSPNLYFSTGIHGETVTHVLQQLAPKVDCED